MLRVVLIFSAVLSLLFISCHKKAEDPCLYCVHTECGAPTNDFSVDIQHRIVKEYASHSKTISCVDNCNDDSCKEACIKQASSLSKIKNIKYLDCFINAVGGTCSKACGLR